MVKKDVYELPHPEAKRKGVCKGCLGGIEYEVIEKGKKVTKVTEDCDKVFRIMDSMDHGNAESNIVCIAYENPEAVWRLGSCNLASNKVLTEEEKKKLNPIKMSKRKTR